MNSPKLPIRRQEHGEEVRRFILDHVQSHPTDIGARTVNRFGISRQAVNRHLQKLTEEGALTASGQTRARRYSLNLLAKVQKVYSLDMGLEEQPIWQNDVAPALADIPPNVLTICSYGITEMVNNAIEHSEGKAVAVEVERYGNLIYLSVKDDGIGVFRKIAGALKLSHPRESLIELAKGKLTTEPTNHTGEGIFFTSRCFDWFGLISYDLSFVHNVPTDDWLTESFEQVNGTWALMQISARATRTLREIFDQFARPEDYAFSKTHVPILLAKYDRNPLISRSQARRVLVRFERFGEVFLDFKGVEMVGQAFADEIFRVFAAQHPAVKLEYVNANTQVEQMIRRAMAARESR